MKIDLERAIEVLTACGYECHEIYALQADNARLREALKSARAMIGHPDNIAIIDEALDKVRKS